MTEQKEVFEYKVKMRPDEYDVIDGDFPEYVEEYPALPEVKVAVPDMDEAYKRNIELAREMIKEEKREERADEKSVKKHKKHRKHKKHGKKKNPRRRVVSLAWVYLMILPMIMAFAVAVNSDRGLLPFGSDPVVLDNPTSYRDYTVIDQRLNNASVRYSSGGVEYCYITIDFTWNNYCDSAVRFMPSGMYAVTDGGIICNPLGNDVDISRKVALVVPAQDKKEFTVAYSVPVNQRIVSFYYGYTDKSFDADEKLKQDIEAILQADG